MPKKATTLKIEEGILKAAKKHAIDKDMTLSELIEMLLRRKLKIR